VRNLEREIGNVCRKIARKVVKEGPEYKIVVTGENIGDFLGVIKFRDTLANEKSEVGLVTGLAWTEVGGSILSTEVTVVDGKGKLTLTGKLGDVMQESAQAAMSYVRSRAAPAGCSRQASSSLRRRSAPHKNTSLAITRKIDSAESKHPRSPPPNRSRPPALQRSTPRYGHVKDRQLPARNLVSRVHARFPDTPCSCR